MGKINGFFVWVYEVDGSDGGEESRLALLYLGKIDGDNTD